MDEMRKCAVALAKVDYEAIERKKITKEFTNKLGRLSSSDEADPLEVALAVQQDFVRYSAATKQAANPVAAKNKCVLEISKLIQIQTGENDDDVQEDLSAPSARPTKCPVSGGELSNPHINRCGHVFSLGGIIGYLRQNAARGDRHVDPKLLEQIPAHWSSRCPIAHCRGKVQRDSLRKDFQSILSQRQQTATAREEEEGDALEVEDLS